MISQLFAPCSVFRPNAGIESSLLLCPRLIRHVFSIPNDNRRRLFAERLQRQAVRLLVDRAQTQKAWRWAEMPTIIKSINLRNDSSPLQCCWAGRRGFLAIEKSDLNIKQNRGSRSLSAAFSQQHGFRRPVDVCCTSRVSICDMANIFSLVRLRHRRLNVYPGACDKCLKCLS